MTEFWLSYHFSSRTNNQPTVQLIELDHLDYKLSDLEDVLDYVFQKGFVDAKYRPAAWWEKKDGTKIKSSTSISSLIEIGVGKCPDGAINLFIEDLPSTLWFSYIYLHNTHTEVVTQRVKLASLSKRLERLANVTNYIFAQGYLPSKYRSVVHWECSGGKDLSECDPIDEILAAGQGVSEDKPLRLVIDNKVVHDHCSHNTVVHDHGSHHKVDHDHGPHHKVVHDHGSHHTGDHCFHHTGDHAHGFHHTGVYDHCSHNKVVHDHCSRPSIAKYGCSC